MRKEGKKAFKEGLVNNIKGKKIENIYHIYGCVSNDIRSKEFNTHIKINMLKKCLDGVECTCEDFKEALAEGNSFMCSHLTGTAYKFFSLASKNAAEPKEKLAETNDNTEKLPTKASIVKLVQKISGASIFYECFRGTENKKIKIFSDNLREFLEGVADNKVKFTYNHVDFTASIIHENLPLTFTLKERNDYFVLTTHKQFPISLTPKNDVFLLNWQLYLPSENQIQRYLPLCEKLKKNGELLYSKNIKNYNNLLLLLSSISKDVNLSEGVRSFSSNSILPEFYMYKKDNTIYCDVYVNYNNTKINILKGDNNKEALLRNYEKEEKILMDMEKFKFTKIKDSFVFLGGDEGIFDILSKNNNSLFSIGKVILGNGFEGSSIYDTSQIKADFYEEDGHFGFSLNINNLESNELNTIFTSYKAGSRFYKTKDNIFINFEDEGIRNVFNLVDLLNMDKKIDFEAMKFDKNKAIFINENLKHMKLPFINGTEILEAIESKLRYINNLDIPLPKTLMGTLRSYQINGFKWLKTLSHLGFGGILADEMGLGKTIQTITFLLSEVNKKTIIICPTSLIYNWKDEVERFAPSLKTVIAHGDTSERIKLISDCNNSDVILTTYGTLRMDIELYEKLIFDFCIIDEGQNIKNPLAQNTKVIKQLNANVRFALTGTPMENNLTELWSIFDFIMPGYLYSKEDFEKKFINGSQDNLEKLKLLIKPFILRRAKKDVIKELPDKIEKKFLVQMTSAQKAVYADYIKTVKENLKNTEENKIEIFSYLTRLRQICLDPSIIIEEYEGGSGKLKVALDLIENHIASNGKLLLFSQFTSVLNNISNNLKEKNISFFQLDGSTGSKERMRLVNEFNNDDDIKVFLISLKAGGTGLNLTSANLVIHFDPWWNPAVENQATDRAHRIGQKNVVEVIKLVAKGTIEEKIILLQEEKKKLIDSIITDDLQKSNLINKLSKEELLQLFS